MISFIDVWPGGGISDTGIGIRTTAMMVTQALSHLKFSWGGC